MRDFLNKYGAAIVIIFIVLAGGIYLTGLRRATSTRTGNPSLAFYIDEDTGEESVQSVTEFPPLIGQSGKPTVVRAIKIVCDNEKTPRTLYLMKYTDEAAALLKTMDEHDMKRPDVMAAGEMVRSPQPGSPWISARDPRAEQLRALPDCPDGKPPIYVYPPK